MFHRAPEALRSKPSYYVLSRGTLRGHISPKSGRIPKVVDGLARLGAWLSLSLRAQESFPIPVKALSSKLIPYMLGLGY